MKDLHAEWERLGEATLKILAKENPEAFARLAVGILPREFEGLPPPVMIFSYVPRIGDEPTAVTAPSLPVGPPIALPQPEADAKSDTDRKEPEPVKAAEPKAEPIPYPPLPEWR